MWGDECLDYPNIAETVIAADVLYDLSSLTPLLISVSRVLQINGYFVLSHVPRVDVERCPLESHKETLERLITSTARKYGLQPPSEVPHLIIAENLRTISNRLTPLLNYSLNDYEDTGATVLIFKRLHSRSSV